MFRSICLLACSLLTWPLPAPPPTYAAPFTIEARYRDFDHYIIAMTLPAGELPREGAKRVPIVTVASLVDPTFQPTEIIWDFGTIYYGGGVRFEPHRLYRLAIRGQSIVWELSGPVAIAPQQARPIALTFSPAELGIFAGKRAGQLFLRSPPGASPSFGAQLIRPGVGRLLSRP